MSRFVTIRRASCLGRRLARYRPGRATCPKGQAKAPPMVRRQRKLRALR